MPSVTRPPLRKISVAVLRLEVPCEGAPERLELFWDRAILSSLVQTLVERLEAYSRESLLLSSWTFAKKSKSLGSTIPFFIYTLPLDSEIFMIKESMLMSSNICFRLEIKNIDWYEGWRSELK